MWSLVMKRILTQNDPCWQSWSALSSYADRILRSRVRIPLKALMCLYFCVLPWYVRSTMQGADRPSKAFYQFVISNIFSTELRPERLMWKQIRTKTQVNNWTVGLLQPFQHTLSSHIPSTCKSESIMQMLWEYQGGLPRRRRRQQQCPPRAIYL
jgi:hypothetical protein